MKKLFKSFIASSVPIIFGYGLFTFAGVCIGREDVYSSWPLALVFVFVLGLVVFVHLFLTFVVFIFKKLRSRNEVNSDD